MNQMSQEPQVQGSKAQTSESQTSEAQTPDVQVSPARESQVQPPALPSAPPPPLPSEPPPVPQHPRFAKPQRVAFVQSSWHREVVEEARVAFLKEAEARHITNIDVFEVPGSFEIPLHAQILAKTRRYTAIVAAGLVVDNDLVADTVIKALMDVQLRTEVPVFSAVLTPQQFRETEVHYDFLRKHFASKGVEVAEACANTLLSFERLRGQVAAGIVG